MARSVGGVDVSAKSSRKKGVESNGRRYCEISGLISTAREISAEMSHYERKEI
jgi:hypothetical protein